MAIIEQLSVRFRYGWKIQYDKDIYYEYAQVLVLGTDNLNGIYDFYRLLCLD